MTIRKTMAWASCLVTFVLITPGTPALAQEGGTTTEVSVATLEGTWEHVSTSQTPDGPREPLDTAKISWTFNADGSGTYNQKVMGRDMGSALFWELDGQKILLQGKKGGKTRSTYTVVAAAADEMTWRNEKLGDYYHVEKR